jgi:glycine/D-amino acid oxidase-like deaminating enzyme
MKNYEVDIAILGGGCIGAAIFHEFYERGIGNVALIDDGRKTTSATAHSAGMLRVFHESPDHTELALKNFYHLQELIQCKVLSQAPQALGNLYFAHRDRFQSYEKSLALMDTAAYPFEILTEVQGRSRFPQFVWKQNEWAIFEPLASFFDPSVFSSTLIERSVHGGLDLLDNFEVLRICPYLGHYRISGKQQSITAKSLVLAGGARMIPRLRDLGISLPLEERVLRIFKSLRKDASEKLPSFFDRESLEFSLLSHPETIVSSHENISRLHSAVSSEKPFMVEAADSYSEGRKGYLGQVPGHPRLILASGWGGTAFKFSLEVAKRTARIVEIGMGERKEFNV